MMKKFVLILLLACLVLGCGVGYLVVKNGGQDSGAPVALSDPEPGTDAETSAIRTLDYAAIRALHSPDEIVGSVDGRSITWEEYFYWLHSVGLQAEEYMQLMAMYGQSLDWTDKLSAESDETLAESVLTIVQDYARQLNVIEAIAEENGVTLTADNEAELAAQLARTIADSCGEGADEEQFNALLDSEMVSRTMFDRINRSNYLAQNIFTVLYGENGAAVPEETALGYLEENGYLSASHILFMTVDSGTMEPLDEETVAQKLKQAEDVSAELRAIEDVSERVKRFAELKAQYCEDTGKTLHPDGYLFPSGKMVTEFEEGTKALGEYEVSEPILSPYGYHIIMRLPLSAEMTIEYSEAGTPLTARAIWANEQYNAMMNSRIENSVFTRADGFALDLLEYLK